MGRMKKIMARKYFYLGEKGCDGARSNFPLFLHDISHLMIVYYVVKGFISFGRDYCVYFLRQKYFHPHPHINPRFLHRPSREACDEHEPEKTEREKNAIMMM